MKCILFHQLFVLIDIFFTIGMADTRLANHSDNLTDITWAHAVDSQKYLLEVLNSDIDFIEADILLGVIDSNTDNEQLIPIMAHPPATTSDITLESFLEQIQNHNRIVEPSKVKGVKLDFKSIDAFEASLRIINNIYDMQSFPTWINADILAGPVNNTETIPVDPKRFFDGIKQLGPVVLSIGWTTKWSQSSLEGCYTKEHINAMTSTIKENLSDEHGKSITFPVRAGIAANSLEHLTLLYETLKEKHNVTFTIWSSENDAVDVEKLRQFIFNFGVNKVYVDVPTDLKNQLHLGNVSLL
uniref:Putative conserved secreted protein n=1 Tax=Aedes albopictus TaxID=7160 RepID=A0A1W7R767_AEDAL